MNRTISSRIRWFPLVSLLALAACGSGSTPDSGQDTGAIDSGVIVPDTGTTDLGTTNDTVTVLDAISDTAPLTDTSVVTDTTNAPESSVADTGSPIDVASTDTGTPPDDVIAMDTPAVDVLPDLPPPPDFGQLPETGAPCTTSCDCVAPLGCFNGTCGVSNPPRYCCSSSTCPDREVCENTDGTFSVCGFDLDTGVITDPCPTTACSSPNRCTNLGCRTCGTNGFCTR